MTRDAASNPELLAREDVVPRVSERAVVLGRMDAHHERNLEAEGERLRSDGAEPIVDMHDVHGSEAVQERYPGVVTVGGIDKGAVGGSPGPIRGGKVRRRAAIGRGASGTPRKPERDSLHGRERSGEWGQERDPMSEVGQLLRDLVAVHPEAAGVVRRPLPADHHDMKRSRRGYGSNDPAVARGCPRNYRAPAETVEGLRTGGGRSLSANARLTATFSGAPSTFPGASGGVGRFRAARFRHRATFPTGSARGPEGPKL